MRLLINNLFPIFRLKIITDSFRGKFNVVLHLRGELWSRHDRRQINRFTQLNAYRFKEQKPDLGSFSISKLWRISIHINIRRDYVCSGVKSRYNYLFVYSRDSWFCLAYKKINLKMERFPWSRQNFAHVSHVGNRSSLPAENVSSVFESFRGTWYERSSYDAS